MNQSIISKGRNVKEAVTTALSLLEASKSDVEIEIIEKESSGIFGIGFKPAVVRVNLNKPKAVNHTVQQLQLDLGKAIEKMDFPLAPVILDKPLMLSVENSAELDGKAWVKDGRIYCRNSPDQYPLVAPCRGLKLYQNRQLVEKTVIVNENDVLSVEMENDVHAPEWAVKVSDDKMESRLEIKPGYLLQRKLQDREPSCHIELRITEMKEPIPIDTRLVVEALIKMGVTVGVDYKEIVNACGSEEPGTFVVARGVKPVPGNNGKFVAMKELEIKKGVKERSDGTVDYREIVEFPTVHRGQIIGTIEPPVPGKPGLTVTGETVMPPEVFPLKTVAGKGVTVIDGIKIVALDAGQPDIKLKGLTAKFSVLPKLTLPHDVDLKHGNVHYAGDVAVLGAVQDGMLVEAMGNITVQGNVNMAKVIAGNSVNIQKNVITSDVTAGKSGILEQELNQLLGEIYERLINIEHAMKQIMNISAYKVITLTRTGLGPLIKLLCDGKFNSVPHLTMALYKQIRSSAGAFDLNAEWMAVSDILFRNLVMPHLSDIRTIDEYRKLLCRIEQLIQSSMTDCESTDCLVKAGYVQNSQVYSAGDIYITGEGVYNSKFYAKGSIHIEGFARGGEYYAEKGIYMRQVGTKGGHPTKIRVPVGQTITIEHALEETTVQIGTKTHTLMQDTTLVRAQINNEGLLVIR